MCLSAIVALLTCAAPSPQLLAIIKEADRLAAEGDEHKLARGLDGLVWSLSQYADKEPASKAEVLKVTRQLAQFAVAYAPAQKPHPEWREQWRVLRLNLDKLLAGVPIGEAITPKQLEMPGEVRDAIAAVDAAFARKDLTGAKAGVERARAAIGRWVQESPAIERGGRWRMADAELAKIA